MARDCDTCRRLIESPIAAWMNLLAHAIDDEEVDDAAYAQRALRRHGVEVRLLPPRVRRTTRRRAAATAEGAHHA